MLIIWLSKSETDWKLESSLRFLDGRLWFKSPKKVPPIVLTEADWIQDRFFHRDEGRLNNAVIEFSHTSRVPPMERLNSWSLFVLSFGERKRLRNNVAENPSWNPASALYCWHDNLRSRRRSSVDSLNTAWRQRRRRLIGASAQSLMSLVLDVGPFLTSISVRSHAAVIGVFHRCSFTSFCFVICTFATCSPRRHPSRVAYNTIPLSLRFATI